MGWRQTFIERPWADVRTFLATVNWHRDEGGYLFDIIDSVLSLGADRFLAVTTSMHDLIVTVKPVDDPAMDVIVVRAPGSLRSPSAGSVLIEFLSVLGRDTEIERPAAEAVPLFWRFVETEFGLRPSNRNR